MPTSLSQLSHSHRRYARFQTDAGPRYGLVDLSEPDPVLIPLDGTPFSGAKLSGGPRVTLAEATLLAPVDRRATIIGIGDNYGEPATWSDPLHFLKATTSLIGTDQPVIVPNGAAPACVEGELAVVIGAESRRVAPDMAESAIFGYTIANDVSARGWQNSDPQWTRAKGADTFCPLGPWITTGLSIREASSLRLHTWFDDELRQDGSTAEMIRSIPQLVSWLSEFMTLMPGDVILTGTPSGAGEVPFGTSVRIAIEGLGELTNTITASPVVSHSC